MVIKCKARHTTRKLIRKKLTYGKAHLASRSSSFISIKVALRKGLKDCLKIWKWVKLKMYTFFLNIRFEGVRAMNGGLFCLWFLAIKRLQHSFYYLFDLRRANSILDWAHCSAAKAVANTFKNIYTCMWVYGINLLHCRHLVVASELNEQSHGSETTRWQIRRFFFRCDFFYHGPFGNGWIKPSNNGFSSPVIQYYTSHHHPGPLISPPPPFKPLIKFYLAPKKKLIIMDQTI